MDVNFTRSWRGNSSFVFSRFKLESWINVFSANREKKKSVCWAFGASSTLFSSLTVWQTPVWFILWHPGSVCKTGTARLPRCSFASTSPGILLCVRRPVLACFTVTFSLTYSLGRGSKLLEILNIFSENDRLVVANHSLGLLIRVGWDPSMHSPVQIKTDFFFSFD